MKYRCPYCKESIEALRNATRCPNCGRAVRGPDFYVPRPKTNAGIMQERRRALLGGPGHNAMLLLTARRPFAIAIMTTVIIIGGLVLLRQLGGFRPEENPDEARQLALDNVSVLRIALERFHSDCGRYPSTDEGLKALVRRPAELQAWDGPYILALKPDPWGNPFRYGEKAGVVVLYSAGPDGIDGTPDDVVAAAPPVSGTNGATDGVVVKLVAPAQRSP